MACLDEQMLLDFLAGRLDGRATASAREHIAQCETCNAIATELIVGAAAQVKAAPIRAASYELTAGAVVSGKYRLLRKIGEGGMGVVWEAEPVAGAGARVAMKLLKAFDATAKKRFLREVETTAALSDPGLVRVVDVLDDVEAGAPALVMELLPGISLAARLDRDRKLGADEALLLAREIAKTLVAVHDAGLVHRDVKPGNIHVTGDPSRPVVLLDLGLAKALPGAGLGATRLTRTGHTVGTPAYMAPEQLAGETNIDARADLWSLGVVLYECLTGELPFVGRTAAHLLRATRAGPPSPLPVPILATLLAPDRAARPPSARAVADALATG